jgi:hypothetical protein
MLSPKNSEILDSIVRANYVFVDDIKNCGSKKAYLEVCKRFPFWGLPAHNREGVHAMTIIQVCGMEHAKWALRRLENKEVNETVWSIIYSYFGVYYSLCSEDRCIAVRKKLMQKLEEILGTPPPGQEMCAFSLYDSWWPENDTGWFLHSKDDINECKKIEEPF